MCGILGEEARLVFLYLNENIMKDKEIRKKCKQKGMYPLSYFLKVFDAYNKAEKGKLIDEDVFDEEGGIEKDHKRDKWNELLEEE